MTHNYIIYYEDLTLRQIQNEDLETLRLWRNNTEETVFLKKIPYITKAMQLNWYKDYLKDNDQIGFSIFSKDKLIGSVSLYSRKADSIEAGKIQIGDSNSHGKQYASKCMAMVSFFAFSALKCQRVFATVNSMNLAAKKSYSRIGFIKIGEEQSLSSFGGIEEILSLDPDTLKKNFQSDLIELSNETKKENQL